VRTLALKDGVYLHRLKPEMIWCVDRCLELFDNLGITLTLTSTTDGNHSNYSHHYKGFAVDLRVWEIAPEDRDEVCERLKLALGNGFQVINETSHIHIEYDPINAAAMLKT
jgi:hypothetical protein